MDIATVIGLIGGLGMVVASMALGSSLIVFVNIPGLTVVIGGTIMCTLVMEKMKNVLALGGTMKMAFFDRAQPIEEMLPLIIHLAAKARKEGLVALEGENIEDPFMARGVRLGVDGLSPEIIKSTLLAELTAVKIRHVRGQGILKFMTATNAFVQDGFAPGTLQGTIIDVQGFITGQFSNGESIPMAQLALANFANVEALKSVGNNRLLETRQSGQALIGGPESGTFGSVRSNTLEQSNVDLATQFVNLIINQRAFQANTRTISVTNELLANLNSLGQ